MNHANPRRRFSGFTKSVLFTLRVGVEPGRWLSLILLSSGPVEVFSHEMTWRAYEASLHPPERQLLIAATTSPTSSSENVPSAEMCRVTLRLIDAETKRPVPGLVRVAAANGAAVPLAGLLNRGIKLRDNHPAKRWFALVEAAEVSLPRTVVTIEAFSGLETETTRKTFDFSGRSSARADVPLTAFSDQGRQGWLAGNTHLHLDALTRAQADEYLRTLPRADRLDVLFVSYLERVNADRTYITNEYSKEELERIGDRHVVVGNGEEHRNNFEHNTEGFGHVMFLNLRRLVKPVSIGEVITGHGPDWPPLRPGMALARNQGATIVWCHNSFGHEDVPSWLGRSLDAQNIFDGGSQGSYADTFYRYLDVGLKVPFSTGTDWFIYDFARVYAKAGAPVTIRSWLDALTHGRTFITNGPLLEFQAGGKEPGNTLTIDQPAELPISGQAKGRTDFVGLELVHDGKVVHRVASRRVGGHYEAELGLRLQIKEPGWIALRVPGGSMDSDGAVVLPATVPSRGGGPQNEMGATLFAHTSPIYLRVSGRDVFRREAAQALIADMERSMARIGAKAKLDHPAQKDEVLQIYRDGIELLRQRIRE